MKDSFGAWLCRPQAILVMAVMSGFGCGSHNHSHSDTPNVPVFGLNNDQYSVLSSDDLRQTINAAAILGNWKLLGLTIAKPDIPNLSRNNASAFAKCAAHKIGMTPLAVAGDSVGFDYDINFIDVCDEAPGADDMVAELNNTAQAHFRLSCVGVDLSQYAGKTLAGADLTGLLKLCQSSSLTQLSLSWKYDARKATKSKVAGGTEITSVVERLDQGAWTGDGHGTPCSIATVEKQHTLQACQIATLTRTFNGRPQDEINAPSETEKPHPQVIQSLYTLKNMSTEDGEDYYHAGDATFAINGWNGHVSYHNGWLAPKWEAGRGKEKVEGTFGTIVSSESDM